MDQLIRQVIEACQECKNRVKKKNITDTWTELRRELKKRSRAKWGQNERGKTAAAGKLKKRKEV
jgi:hypothetical protein